MSQSIGLDTWANRQMTFDRLADLTLAMLDDMVGATARDFRNIHSSAMRHKPSQGERDNSPFPNPASYFLQDHTQPRSCLGIHVLSFAKSQHTGSYSNRWYKLGNADRIAHTLEPRCFSVWSSVSCSESCIGVAARSN